MKFVILQLYMYLSSVWSWNLIHLALVHRFQLST